MAKFDESKVINSLHPDRAEVGKKYYFNDTLYELKMHVENKYVGCVGTLDKLVNGVNPFSKRDGASWQFIYPCEEPPKQRMTNRMLSEWLAKGNGERSYNNCTKNFFSFEYDEYEVNEEVDNDIVIRSWDSEEWIEPTIDVYMRDCK